MGLGLVSTERECSMAAKPSNRGQWLGYVDAPDLDSAIAEAAGNSASLHLS